MPQEDKPHHHKPTLVQKGIKLLKEKTSFIITGGVLLTLFYTFSFFFAKGGKLDQFNFNMTVRIQDKIPVKFDPYLSTLSLIGSFEGTSIILAIALIVRRKIGGIIVFGMFGFMHVVEIIGKAFLDHPGTPFRFHRYALDFVFPSGYVQPGGSYPSGHAMRTAFLAIVISYIISKTGLNKYTKLASYIFIFCFYLIMIISRVSLGEHWTSDVIGGSLLGAGFAFLALIFI